MNPLEKAFIDLFRGNISLSNEKIFTGNRYRPVDMSPCITIQQASEVQVSGKQMPGLPEMIRLENNVEIWVNIWCDTEEERNSLIEEVETRILQALANHYTTCAKYDDGHCDFLNNDCATPTITNGHTAKNQCPYPIDYGYSSFFEQNHIIKRTFGITGKQELDELELSKPVLRTIIKLDMNYYKFYNIGGHKTENILIDEELL